MEPSHTTLCLVLHRLYAPLSSPARPFLSHCNLSATRLLGKAAGGEVTIPRISLRSARKRAMEYMAGQISAKYMDTEISTSNFDV